MKPLKHPSVGVDAFPDFSGKDSATIELINQWIRQDVTGDPEYIARAEADVEEFKRRMNENRLVSGETPVL
jgi:hypothetical protein